MLPVLDDLALNKPAWQSSDFSASTPASLAVDGNADTIMSHGSCSQTNADPYAWWAVDLGAEYSVESVAITNRGDCCGRYSGFIFFQCVHI